MSENKSENKPMKNDSIKKPSKIKTFFKIFFLVLLLTMVTGVTLLGGYVFSIIKNTPPLDVNAILKLNETSTMVEPDGEFLTNIVTTEERFVVKSEDYPQHLKNAYISIEDERFYTHKGVDVRRLVGSQLANVKNALAGTLGNPQGGSTITQQLIKNTVLTNEVSIVRKVKEMYLAINLEKVLSKDEILTAYLNTIPMGGHQYGLEAASLRYFNKSVKDISIQQAAYLAGITQAPSSYSAFSEKNQADPSVYINRTKTVLRKMSELGFLTEEEFNANIDVTPESLEFDEGSYTQVMHYEWFTRPVLSQVKADLQEKLKYTEEEANKLLVNGGLTIYTTIDRELQDTVQSILNDPDNFAPAYAKSKDKKETLTSENVPELQATACVIDYRTGEVKALVGGRGDQPAMSINRAYNTLRSVGSTTKPLTAFAPAIDLKVMGAGSVVDDSPLSKQEQSNTGYNGIQPQNANRSYAGYQTLREALRVSSNTVPIKIVSEIGLSNARAYGEKFGLVYDDNASGGAALALGQSESPNDGGNVFKVAAAYGTFGNNGVLVEPILYTKVLDASGNVLLENTPDQTNVISPQTAYIMYDMLISTAKNFGSRALFGNMPVAGKTGTSSDNKDYWFAGLTPYYSAAVWVGYDIPTEMNGNSSKSAPPIWGKIMSKAHEGLEYKNLSSPGGISKISVCMDSGHLPTDLCKSDQRGSRVTSDWFIDGTAPSKLCTTHVKAKVNTSNNKLANENTPENLVGYKVFITRPSGYTGTADSKYLLPTAQDDTVYTPPVEEKPEPENKPNPENPNKPPTPDSNGNNGNNGNSGNTENDNDDTND